MNVNTIGAMRSAKFQYLDKDFEAFKNKYAGQQKTGTSSEGVSVSDRRVSGVDESGKATFEDYSGAGGSISSFFGKIGRFFRRGFGSVFGASTADETLRNISKDFYQSVSKIFGDGNIPPEVEEAMGVHAKNFGNGMMRPLTEYRIQVVNQAIENYLEDNIQEVKDRKEAAQINDLVKPGNIPQDNLYLGDNACGAETGNLQRLVNLNGESYSIFDAKTNTTRDYLTYPQGGGTGAHCFFLSTLRHLNITPSNLNARRLRETMNEAYQQLKEVVDLKLWQAKKQLLSQKSGYENQKNSLEIQKKTAQGTELMEIEKSIQNVESELRGVEFELTFIDRQLGANAEEPEALKNGNLPPDTCPVSYEGGHLVINDENNPDNKPIITELFTLEQNPNSKVFSGRSTQMADVAHAAMLPLVLKRPVIIVEVNHFADPINNVLDGSTSKFTKNILTGEDYSDKSPVYIRYQRSPCNEGVGFIGHFEAMLPDKIVQKADPMKEICGLLNQDDMKETGFLTKKYVNREIVKVLNGKLPSDEWKKHLKLEALNNALNDNVDIKIELQNLLKDKLAEVAKNIDAGVTKVVDINKKLTTLDDEFNTWLSSTFGKVFKKLKLT